MDKKSKAFIFSLPHCGLCKQLISKFEFFPNDIYVVETDIEEDLLNIDIDAVPLSLAFDKDGNQIYKKYGLLNSLQLSDFKDLILELKLENDKSHIRSKKECGIHLDGMINDSNFKP